MSLVFSFKTGFFSALRNGYINRIGSSISIAKGKNHVNGIESFWSYAKRRLLKFNGIHKAKFLLHLKESEFRRNMRITHVNMYKELLKNFREKSL